MALKTTNKNRKKVVEVVEEPVVEKVNDLYSATDWIDKDLPRFPEKVIVGIAVICAILFFFV